uniref:Conserved domain protein n=1 Tax=Strongyloides venezuelensis TaxID=75913 RepID=A0A0K0FTF1_STRVS
MMKKYGYINSVINGKFFVHQRTQDTPSKKERYLFNDSQTLTVIYDLPVMNCDENEQLEASMEEKIKELSFIMSEE